MSFMPPAESASTEVECENEHCTQARSPASLIDDIDSLQTVAPASSLLGSLTLPTPTASADNVLDWDMWTKWTVCYMSHVSKQHEKMRFKLCSHSDGPNQHQCNHSLVTSHNFEQQFLLSKSSNCRNIHCFRKCLLINLELSAYSVEREECVPDVDGHWSSWMQWSKCTTSCGQGTRFRQRACVGQSGYGGPCVGQEKEGGFCYVEERPPGNCISFLDGTP